MTQWRLYQRTRTCKKETEILKQKTMITKSKNLILGVLANFTEQRISEVKDSLLKNLCKLKQ